MEDFISNIVGGGASHKTGYPAGAGVSHGPDEDFNNAAQHASEHAGASGDHGLFSNALSLIGSRKQEVVQGDIDEEEAVQSHKTFFGGGDGPSEASPRSMGTAAAVQAMKMFTGGQAGGSTQSQSQFIGLAMGEAAKLFEQQAGAGRVSGGEDAKSSAIQQAGEMAMKMYMKSQLSGGGGGGFNMMSLVGKLL